MPFVTLSLLVSSAAYAALAVAGLVLWRRRGSAAGAAIATGFALVLLGQVSRWVEYREFSAILHGHSTDTLFIVHHHAYPQLAELLGLSLAAAGLVWHAVRAR